MPISQAPRFNLDMFMSEQRRTVYLVEVPVDLQFDEILKPSFWAHVGERLRPRDVIEVWPKDNTWRAEFFVIEAGRNFAKVSLREKHEVKTEKDDPLTIEPLATGKFRVRRGNDVMKEDLASKKEAQRWIDDYGQAA